jgi:hypothetical protein
MAISGTYTAGDAVSFKDALVEVELTGADSVWADIDSWATEVTISGEEVPTSETYPFEGDPITFAGNKTPVRVEVAIVYTEGTAAAFYQIRTRFEAAPGGSFDVRITPKGSGSGNLKYTTSGGKLVACPPPVGAGDASSATLCRFVVVADGIAMAAS